ncbi:uncharacterized protein [Parasteatoda tepidariorum]
MSEGRRLRVREQGGTKGSSKPSRPLKKVRNRLSSVNCSNEESTEGEDDQGVTGGARKISGSNRSHRPADDKEEEDLKSGLPIMNGKNSALAEEDIIDGFLILSFLTYQDLEHEMKGSVDKMSLPADDILPEGVVNSHSEGEMKEGIRNGDESNCNHIFSNGLDDQDKDEFVGENNNEPTTPNQNFVSLSPKPEELLPSNNNSHSRLKTESKEEKTLNNTCDTAEEAKKVPPDLEAPSPETPKQDVTQTSGSKGSPTFPVKNSPHFLPLQNGPLQQPEPSAAVAAVTAPTSAANPATVPASSQIGASNPTPLPSSTSPAGGVPFPSSLLGQEDFPVSPNAVSNTVSPVLSSKNYDSVVKSPRGSNSDVVHSLPYPICSSYSDYTVSYSANQYSNNKHSYPNQEPRESQRYHHQKLSSNSYYQHHHQQQPIINKYSNTSSKEVISNSKDVIACDGYKNENYVENRYENKTGTADVNYCVGQAFTNEKTCDPQTLCKKPSANNVYNFKSNELLTQNSSENPVRNTTDKTTGKLVGEPYPSVNKNKVPNRTTYYQSIVNKSHSRHKSSRRVLPASAYENSKQVINNYQNPKSEIPQGHSTKPVQYSSYHYPTENKKNDYYQSVSSSTAGTTNSYNCNTYKTDVPQSHLSNNVYHNNYSDSHSVSNSRNLKVNSEQYISGYRDKQSTNSAIHTSSKTYNYHHSNKNYSEPPSKLNSENIAYGNAEYYQKGSVNYSRSGTNQNTVSDNYKNSSHVSEHSSYSHKNHPGYHHSRTSSEKNRNYYPTQDNHYKAYPENHYKQDIVPKRNTEETHPYKIQNELNNYQNYGNSNSLKTRENTLPNSEPSVKVASHDLTPNQPETVQTVQPPVPDNIYPTSSSKDKTTPFYPYSESTHYHHKRTPPPSSKLQTSFDAPKESTDTSRVSATNSTGPNYPSQRPTVNSPITIQDNSRSSGKTLWSPTAISASGTSSSREVVPPSGRDSQSSHSNSSISSLSQLSQSLGPAPQGTSGQSSKEFSREGRSSSNGHSRSSSRNETPVSSAALGAAPVTSSHTSSSSSSYGVSGSLTSLIFSKPSWTSPSVTTVLTNPQSHFTPPATGRISSPVPSILPLAPSLPNSHHSSPFSNHSSSSSALNPAAGHHVMFAPPLPPAGSLSSPSLPLATAPGPSLFGASESLFAPPPNQDLLNIRRELDTRFLASQDRSINVPPPPYLRAEMHQHQHQHTHMHQHSPFLPPPLGSPLLPPSAAHLYDKFPKVDSSFYGRNALGLPTYPSLSPLLAPGSATATPTPFAPPGALAAFQPKISPLVKTKSVKPGRWCAMHVRISWEIYRHQQKQQADSQKGGTGPSKGMSDLLRPPNHLFSSIPRPHELGFSSSLLGAASSIPGRSPYEVTPQHPGFLGPTPAHLGITPFARPAYPTLGVPGNSFGGLGGLSLAGASMLAGRELGPGYLSMAQDPWSRLHRTPPNFSSPSSLTPSAWGGLKAEAEKDRVQKRDEQEQREKEKEKLKKAESEKRESEKSKEISRESKREHEKQKERDRENRASHISSNPEVIRNGEIASDRNREWERSRERRDSSRSPIRSTHKSDVTFDGSSSGHNSSKSDVKVKEEKKEDDHNKESNSANPSGTTSADRERAKSNELSHSESNSDYMSRGMIPGLPMGLSASEQARLSGSLAAMSQVPPPHFWNPLPPPQSSAAERYRSLELQQARDMDREQLMQKYASISSVMPLIPERYREAELARHLSSSEAAAREVERQLQADRDRQVYERTKLPPPPLRPNDPPYVGGPPPGPLPPGGMFPSLGNPFLNSLCVSNYPPRTKPGSPASIGNGIPPPLIPCVSQGSSPVATSTPSPLHLKLGTPSNSSVEASREHYTSKDRREMSSHSATELESQSR